MSRWTTYAGFEYGTSEPPAGYPRPTQPVYLDGYLIDAHEVTNEAYAAFVAGGGGEPPPEQCGYLDREELGALWTTPPLVPEVSGWQGDEPEAGRAEHPVVCVTRAEAKAFCASRGGRLPTVAEWIRAGRSAYPDDRRFPWGETPPPNEPMPWPDASYHDFFEQQVVSNRHHWGLGDDPREPGRLFTAPADAPVESAGPHGVRGLSGNVSELLGECRENLGAVYGEGDAPRIRPERVASTRCSEAVLVGGANWRSMGFVPTGALSLFVMRDGDRAIDYIEAASHPHPIRDDIWGETEAGPDAPTGGAGNERRSWRIGFRCAYDLPKE